MSRYLPLICLALAHTLVDTCAQLIEPLWPDVRESFQLLSAGALSVAFIVQSLPTSLSQAVFGYIRDRKSTPTILWLGPLLAAVCMSAIGLSDSKVVLGILLLVGGVGIGAFHPEAAVAAGRALPEQRTRALSLFMLGGALGLGLGPTLSGSIVRTWGLEGLIYLLPVMLILIVVLWRVGRLGSLSPPAPAHHAQRTIKEMFEGRGLLALSIFLICSLRLVPNMGMTKVLSFALNTQGFNEQQIGHTQSLFLVAASVGMFVMAFRFRSGLERRFMIWCPLLGAPMLLILGWDGCPTWLFFSMLALTGLTLWGTTPAMVSYAQQMFPRGAGLASAITMGLAWGLGGLIHTPITAHYSDTAVPQQALWGYIPCLLLASAGAWLLPSTESERKSAVENEVVKPSISTEPQSNRSEV